MDGITLTHHQAQAVAERMTRLARLQRGRHRALLTIQNPYTTPDTHGVYLEIEGRAGTRSPLFAKDLGADRTFDAARLPARDDCGHVFHPDMDGIGDDEYDMTPQLRALGWHSTTCSFEDDADEAMSERYEDSNSPDCSYWTPTAPEGEGWLLAAIYDTEDGPVAMFVKRAE